jgi:hypothetical protein
VRSWLKSFYLAAACLVQGGPESPLSRDQLLERRRQVESGTALPLQVNVEAVLTLLYRWRLVVGEAGTFHLNETPEVDADARSLTDCLGKTRPVVSRVHVAL